MYVQSRVWLRANQTQTKVRQTDEACHSPAQPTSRTLFFNDAAEVRVPQRGDLLFLFADCCTIEINKGKKSPGMGFFLVWAPAGRQHQTLCISLFCSRLSDGGRVGTRDDIQNPCLLTTSYYVPSLLDLFLPPSSVQHSPTNLCREPFVETTFFDSLFRVVIFFFFAGSRLHIF